MSLPLQDRTILITRSLEQASQFRRLLEDQGACVLELPTIQIRPRPTAELDLAVSQLSGQDWLMFTSVNAVEIFLDRVQSLGRLSELSQGIRICTIGPATAQKVKEYGCSVDLIPEIYQAEGVLEAFSQYHQGKIKGLRVLLPRASQAREILPRTLSNQGALVDLVHIYDTVIPEQSPALFKKFFHEKSPDLVTFTSSSTVRNFLELARNADGLAEIEYAAIGPITAATAREHGLQIVVQPEISTIPELARAIAEYFRPSQFEKNGHADTNPRSS